MLAANRGSLRQLELAGCPTLTDAALLHLLPAPAAPALAPPSLPGAQQEQPAQRKGHQTAEAQLPAAQLQQAGPPRRPAAPPLQHLSLVCCDRVQGATLRQLGRLRSLRLSGCPAVEEAALQVRWAGHFGAVL